MSSLYRRGKYSPSKLLDQDDKKQERKRLEEFAVAALAFTMKHDRKFKCHFLKKICGADMVGNSDDYEIHVQPHDFDLTLENKKKSEVIVLEIKVGARLEDHQEFNKTEKFFESNLHPKGYGYQIDTFYGHRNKYYVTLIQSDFSDKYGQTNGQIVGKCIRCSSRTWLDLLLPEKDMSSLVKDLFDCLAESMGIDELKGRLFMNKNLAEHTQAAIEMKGVLDSVRIHKDLGFYDRASAPKFDNQSFGVEVKKSLGGFANGFKCLEEVCEDRFIWFGYEPGCASVWICGLKDDAKTQELRKIIGTSLPQSLFDFQKSDQESLVLVPSQASALGDQEWFIQILIALKNLPSKPK
jgi:hypothetical protein